jgi:hypothetical protein
MKQQNNFGKDVPAAPDNVPMRMTVATVRDNTVNARRGKSALTRAGNATTTANPYKSGWNDPSHIGLLGF